MNLVFLDIDGVVRPFTCGMEFDPRCMRLLKRIVEETNASIVLSSSWRTSAAGIRLVNLALTRYGMEHVIDITPDFKGGRRPEEILSWLSSNKLKHSVRNWVALDDIDLAYNTPAMKGHFVHTDGRRGLTEELARKAIYLLLGEEGKPTRRESTSISTSTSMEDPPTTTNIIISGGDVRRRSSSLRRGSNPVFSSTFNGLSSLASSSSSSIIRRPSVPSARSGSVSKPTNGGSSITPTLGKRSSIVSGSFVKVSSTSGLPMLVPNGSGTNGVLVKN